MNQPAHSAIERLVFADGQHKAQMNDAVLHVARMAYAHDGLRAFECQMARLAAYHEAGHAVLYEATGDLVDEIWIKRIRVGGTLAWIGECIGGDPWEVNEHTLPAADLRCARQLMAGFLSEAAFVPEEARCGSSLDEAVLAGSICSGIAQKTGRQRSDVLLDAVSETLQLLRQHERHIHKIAAALVLHRRLRGPRLARLTIEVRHGR